MKLLTQYLVLAVGMLLAVCETTQAQWRFETFMGYNTKQTPTEAQKICRSGKGQWSEVMGFHDTLDHLYACEYRSQETKEINMYETLPVRAKLVFIGTVNGEVVFVNYAFRFKTWDARNQFKLSVLSSIRGIFWMVKRLTVNNYEVYLNELLYLELVDDNSSTEYFVTNLFLSKSDEGMDSYISGDGILQ